MLYTRICDLLGVEHPILGAPMSGGIAAADLAAAISEAGGFGLIGGMTTGGTDWVTPLLSASGPRWAGSGTSPRGCRWPPASRSGCGSRPTWVPGTGT